MGMPDELRDQTLAYVAEPETPAGEPQHTFASPVSVVVGANGSTRHTVAGYELMDELGRGGMGVVYKARHVALNRVVALKMVLAGEHSSPDQLARFRAEAEAVAQLQHPNIVQVYEVGDHDGQPFFSLEYVGGGSLAARLNGQPQPPRAAAGLVEALAAAMQFAHEHGIVHRDLKPANVLLQAIDLPRSGHGSRSGGSRASGTFHHATMEGVYGTPKIADFGLAKRLDSAAGHTHTGSILGTPSYMSPEQAEGRTRDVGPATDVYALGAILYELLTGRPPFRAESPIDTVLMVIRDDPVSVRSLQPKVPRDLETICLTCLRKSPQHRYPSAGAMADDLRCYLDGEPISARRATAWEHLKRWVKRRPVLAASSGVALIAGAALVASGYGYHKQIERALGEAQVARDRSQEQLVRLTVANGAARLDEGDLLVALPWFALALEQEADLPERAEMHRIRLAAVLRQCPRLIQVRCRPGRVSDVAIRPDGGQAASADEGGMALLWRGDGTGNPVELAHPAAVSAVQYDRAGTRLLTVAADRAVRVWESATGKPAFAPLDHPAEVRAAAFSTDGAKVLTACADGVARLWDAATGQRLSPEFTHRDPLTAAVLSPNGARVATADAAGVALVWDAATGQALTQPMLHGGAVRSLAWSPDGRRLLAASDAGAATVWDAATGQPACPPLKHRGPVLFAAYSPDGERTVTCGSDRHARVWNAVTGEPVTPPLQHASAVLHASFAPDGESVATAGDDNTARVWDATTGQPSTPPLRHSGTVVRAIFGPSGRGVITAGQDGTARVWDLIPGDGGGSGAAGGAVAFSPDGRLRIAPVDGGRAVRVFDAATGKPTTPPLAHIAAVLYAGFSGDGRLVLTCGADREAKVWDATTGQPVGPPVRHASEVMHAAFGPGGTTIATASADNTARVWDVATGTPRTPPLKHAASVNRVAFSPDGRAVLTATSEGDARVWDARTGEPVSPALAGERTAWVGPALAGGDGRRGWDLPPDARPVADLLDLSRWLSGLRPDTTGGLVPLTNDELLAVGKRLQATYPAEFVRPPEEIRRWHERQATAAEAARHWPAARFHLDRLIAPAPQCSEAGGWLARRARAFAERGDWAAARDDFAQALERGPPTPALRADLARCALAAGDAATYCAQCRHLWDRDRAALAGPAARELAVLCLLAPGAVSDPAALAVYADPVDEALAGAALVRAGQVDAGRQRLQDAPVAPGPDAVDHRFGLALAAQLACDDAAVARWLALAVAQQAKLAADPATPWQRKAVWRILRAEIEAGR